VLLWVVRLRRVLLGSIWLRCVLLLQRQLLGGEILLGLWLLRG
jgi:hypothetical protein